MENADSPRQNKARERQQRRRARQQAVESPAASRRRARTAQLAPAGERELPQIDFRRLRPFFLGVGAVVFMLAVIVGVGMFKNNPVVPAANAIWLGIEWTYADRSDDDIRNLVAQLRDHQIGIVYAHVSELNVDSTWTGRTNGQNRFDEVEANVTAFVEKLNRFYPEAELYGVLGIRADIGEDSYRLDDENVVRTVASFSTQVVNTLGFDGVMLNVEPVWNGDEFFIALIRQVRQTIGDTPSLAVAVPPDWTPTDVDIPTPSLIAPGTAWDNRYKQRIAILQIDQMVVHTYNSYLTRSDEYADWVAYQVATFSEAVAALETDVELIFGVPTYEDVRPAHDKRVENVQSAVIGIQRGLVQAGTAASSVRGVALFAEWDIETPEWELFQELWLQE